MLDQAYYVYFKCDSVENVIIQIIWLELSLVAHAKNPSIWEVEVQD